MIALPFVLALTSLIGAHACVCPTFVPGDPLCSFQYVLVGKAIDSVRPNCQAPLRPDGSTEIADFDEFAKFFVNFEVEAILKQPELEDSPPIQEGQTVQIWSSITEEACGFTMTPDNSYVITAFVEDLALQDQCLFNRDPERTTLDLSTTAYSMNVENPTVLEVLAWADDCGAEFGVETPPAEIQTLEAVEGP